VALSTLTAIEASGLDRPINLADGHAKLRPAARHLPGDLLHQLDRRSQVEIESKFLRTYGAAANEAVPDAVLFPSASLAIDAVAKHLHQSGRLQVGLLEPAFDNLALLLRRAALDIKPVDEAEEDLVEAAAHCDALVLILPNNPTGWVPSQAALSRVAAAADKSGCLIVCDRTFRFFRPGLGAWPRETACDWITIDDTGKTWSTLECKTSFVMASNPSALSQVKEIAQEITLNVSKVALYIATDAIERENGAARVRSVVLHNRRELSRTLLPIGYRLSSQSLSVALLELPSDLPFGAAEFSHFLAVNGIAVLPGPQFYWYEPQRGHSQIRIAMARPPSLFRAGMARICALTLGRGGRFESQAMG